jgi:hypothetical protein
VRAFCAAHTEQRAASLLFAVLRGFQRELDEGGSRHDAMVTAACWAAREARVGAYPASTAFERLQAAFIESLRAPRVGSTRTATESVARAEFAGIDAWAVAQANVADLADVRRKIEQRIPDFDVPPPAEPSTNEWENSDGYHSRNGADAGGDPPERPVLEFLPFAKLAAKVDAAGPRRWLLRGVWPAGTTAYTQLSPKHKKRGTPPTSRCLSPQDSHGSARSRSTHPDRR